MSSALNKDTAGALSKALQKRYMNYLCLTFALLPSSVLPCSTACLLARLDEPEPFVDAPGDLDEGGAIARSDWPLLFGQGMIFPGHGRSFHSSLLCAIMDWL